MKNDSLTTLPFKAFSMEGNKGITLGNEYTTTQMTAVTSSYSFSLISACRFSCPGLAEEQKSDWFGCRVEALVVLGYFQERFMPYLCKGNPLKYGFDIVFRKCALVFVNKSNDCTLNTQVLTCQITMFFLHTDNQHALSKSHFQKNK